MLELRVVAPDKYDFVSQNLTGGIKLGNDNSEDVLSYVRPYVDKPICYVSDKHLRGAALASTIAHESWHVYQAKNGMDISESEANIYENLVFDLLLRECIVRNRLSWIHGK